MTYKYKITISNLENNSMKIVEIEKNFEKIYLAQNELKNIGTNGLMFAVDESKIYYPPNRILEITMKWKD